MHMNQSLLVKLEFPLISNCFNIQCGDIFHMVSMPYRQKAAAIDFTKVSTNFGQVIYPLFFVTSVKKDLQRNIISHAPCYYYSNYSILKLGRGMVTFFIPLLILTYNLSIKVRIDIMFFIPY